MYRFERDGRALLIFETIASHVTAQNHELDDNHDMLLNYASVLGLNVSQLRSIGFVMAQTPAVI